MRRNKGGQIPVLNFDQRSAQWALKMLRMSLVLLSQCPALACALHAKLVPARQHERRRGLELLKANGAIVRVDRREHDRLGGRCWRLREQEASFHNVTLCTLSSNYSEYNFRGARARGRRAPPPWSVSP